MENGITHNARKIIDIDLKRLLTSYMTLFIFLNLFLSNFTTRQLSGSGAASRVALVLVQHVSLGHLIEEAVVLGARLPVERHVLGDGLARCHGVYGVQVDRVVGQVVVGQLHQRFVHAVELARAPVADQLGAAQKVRLLLAQPGEVLFLKKLRIF